MSLLSPPSLPSQKTSNVPACVASKAGIRKFALTVLTLNRDQRRPDVFQDRERGLAAIDQDAAAPLCPNLPPDNQSAIVVRRYAVEREVPTRRAAFGQNENALDDGLRTTATDEILGSRPTAEKRQSPGDHRLAGAGLARQHRQGGTGPDHDVSSERQVDDAEFDKHQDQTPRRRAGAPHPSLWRITR